MKSHFWQTINWIFMFANVNLMKMNTNDTHVIEKTPWPSFPKIILSQYYTIFKLRYFSRFY